MTKFYALARRLASSWRFVTTVGSALTVLGVVLWGASQAAVALAQSGTAGYGAVLGATTGPPAATTAATSTPVTGAGLFWPAMVLLVGLACVAVGLFMRQSSQASQ